MANNVPLGISGRYDTEARAVEQEGPPRPGEQLLEALVQGLERKGLVSRDDLARAMVCKYTE